MSNADTSHFFAHLGRMKLINRWPLMRSIVPENVQEHSLQVAMVAHALALIKVRLFEGDINPDALAMKALFHDASEVLTGDLPSPIKYFNPNIRDEYKKIEAMAEQTLIDMVPEPLKDDYASLIAQDQLSDEEHKLIKSADLVCAYLKAVEEIAAGNQEFVLAKKRLKQGLEDYQSPELSYFMRVFVPSFGLSLDEITEYEL